MPYLPLVFKISEEAYANALSPTTASKTVFLDKQLPMCLPVENNHTAHADYLRLKVERQKSGTNGFCCVQLGQIL